MGIFNNLLNQPLPSRMYEAEDTDIDKEMKDTMGSSKDEACEGCDSVSSRFIGYEDDDEDDDDDDQLCNCDDGETCPQCDSSDTEPAKPLTPDQSQKVDDVINVVATPILLKDELPGDGLQKFAESMDSDIAMAEGFITERTIVRFDKNAKKAQLFETAVAACAREHKDPLYRKLETAYKIERTIKAKLRRKYRSQANQKVKEYLARARKSKSGILSKIAKKISK